MMGSWVRAPVGSQKVIRYTNDLFFFKAMWRNGRLAILRGWCSQGREGSNPSMVTNKNKRLQNNQACLKLFCKRLFFQSGALRERRSQSLFFKFFTSSLLSLIQHFLGFSFYQLKLALRSNQSHLLSTSKRYRLL